MFVHVRRVSINRTLIAGLFIAATVGSYQAQSAGSFSPADSMAGARASVPAILLQDGRVLLAGQDASSSASEVYDAATGSFTPTGSLNQARSSAGASIWPVMRRRSVIFANAGRPISCPRSARPC